jgi:hypothetical protein
MEAILVNVINKKVKRPKLTNVGIRQSTKERLENFAYTQNPRLVIADIISIAVEAWLDKQEGGAT